MNKQNRIAELKAKIANRQTNIDLLEEEIATLQDEMSDIKASINVKLYNMGALIARNSDFKKEIKMLEREE